MQKDRTASRTQWLALVIVAAAALPCFGQVRINIPGQRAPDEGPGVGGGNLFTQNRGMTRVMREARELINSENYAEALLALQQLIDAPSDAFFPEDVERGERYVSIKAESMRLIETLPPKGRTLYELKYGLVARTALEDALEQGDFAGIAAVARKYFHTPAGYRATYLLGTQQLDSGVPLSAALQFERLRKLKKAADRNQFEPMLSLQTAVCWGRAGMPKVAMQTLSELKQFQGGQPIRIGGRNVPLFDRPENSLRWLAKVLGNQGGFAGIGQEQWVMFRGNSSRTAYSSPASPVWDAKWNVDTVLDPDFVRSDAKRVNDEIESFSQRRRKDGLLMQPAGHPLLVGDLAIFRTLERPWAVNVRTGAVAWKGVQTDKTYQKLAGGGSIATANRGRVYRTPNTSNLTQLQMFLDQRLWRDMTAGTLSSDGDLVFCVDSLGFHDRVVHYRNVGGRMQPYSQMEGVNTLTIYDAKTGKLAGQLGGKGDDPLSGYFFLGAPLPLGDQLFVLADHQGEIRLLVIQLRKERLKNGGWATHPDVLWVQTLATPNEGVTSFPLRRMAGLSPSYSGGVLLCPTTAGAVVAVDPARRLLLWGYRYPTNTESSGTGRNPFNRGRYSLPTNRYDAESRWLDAGITVAGSRIILTPRDSNELHCVGVNGEVIWKQPRAQRLYVAAVHDEKLILVGKSQIEALNLRDGSPAWKQPTPLPMPSGRGFQTRDFYHVPLQTAEIATIDLRDGRVLARAKTRSERVPGNLVSANGLIVSQTVNQVMGFKPLDALESEIAAQLKANPKDGKALGMRGEIRLRNGDEEGGLADLRAAVAAGAPDRAKALLASNLLEGLRLDFARFRKYRPELDRILTDDEQRGRYHRLLAAGLDEIGEHRDAFRQYLKLAGPNTGPWKQERVGDVTVRSDRWLQSRIAGLFGKAAGNEREQLVAEVKQQLDQAIKFTGPKGLRRFSLAFGDLPGTDKARRLLARRLNPTADALELELVLLRLRDSSNVESAAFATARLAKLMVQHGEMQAATELVAELEDRFARTDCGQDKTGAQWAAELRKQNPKLVAAQRSVAWPNKRFVAQAMQTGNNRYYPPSYSVEFLGPRGFFRNWSFPINTRSPGGARIEARDGRGTVRWTLGFHGRISSYYYYNATIRAYGHLLVVILPDRFMVVNALGATTRNEPPILWQRALFKAAGRNQNIVARGMLPAVRGRRRWILTDPFGNPLGTVGHFGPRAVVYQSGRTLYAADPLTGDVLWKRGSVERGSRLFGDDDHLFVAGPNANSAQLLSQTDGQSLGTRPIARKDVRKLTRGRFELTWRLSGTKYVLSWSDVLNKKSVWEKQFSDASKLYIIDEDEVAVIEPKKGRFHVISLDDDGDARVDSPIETDDAIGHILVRRTSQRYVLITYSTARRDDKFGNVNGVTSYSPLVNGFVYGFDRKTGKKIWTTYVGSQAIAMEQPENMPVLIFAARRYPGVRRGLVSRRYTKLGVTILDKRNGRIILDYSRDETSVTPYELDINPESKTIQVKFRRTQFTLTMSDAPLGKPSNRVFVPKNQGGNAKTGQQQPPNGHPPIRINLPPGGIQRQR